MAIKSNLRHYLLIALPRWTVAAKAPEPDAMVDVQMKGALAILVQIVGMRLLAVRGRDEGGRGQHAICMGVASELFVVWGRGGCTGHPGAD